jgi:oligoendopeptidase F
VSARISATIRCMKRFALLAAILAAGTPSAYHLDLSRYFPNTAVEQMERKTLLAAVDAFNEVPASSLNSPETLRGWLVKRDLLYQDLHKHDIYVYLRAEEDTDDDADAAADTALSEAMDRVDNASDHALDELGPATINDFIARDAALQPYRYFVEHALQRSHFVNQNDKAVTLLALPSLKSLADSYKSLRRLTQPIPASKQTESAGKNKFEATWDPYIKNETAFAGLLIPIVHLQDGKARLQGFNGAPEAAYFSRDLTSAEVSGVLSAIRGSGAYKRYETIVAAAAARQLHIAPEDVRTWDLDAADTYQAPSTPFVAAIPLILAAEGPMGAEYADQFGRLFDPANHRVELCESDRCDSTGFSVGFSGTTSGLFYGSYRGTTDNIRAVAHEAGHAVHREFMNVSQPIAAYNSGPHFVFESFAIFNELLLLDHLYQTAATPAAKAYYLHQFLDDATFQIYGSAKETDLEQSIYTGVQDGTLNGAADLDALTLKVFSQYVPAPLLSPEMKVYWARNRLYFTDPLYDVNYLFAGLLALEYWRQFEADSQDFAKRYVALLKNGFTDAPRLLERRFLGIDLDDTDGMVTNASKIIDSRTPLLQKLYERVIQNEPAR